MRAFPGSRGRNPAVTPPCYIDRRMASSQELGVEGVLADGTAARQHRPDSQGGTQEGKVIGHEQDSA